jgi:membrane associated rhomboid family serine protease
MKPLDFAKAAGVAIVILIISVVIAILAVLFYSFFIHPGESKEFYDAAAQRIAPWCSHIGGAALFFIAGYFFARRNRERNPYLFALTFTVLYIIIDGATVAFKGIFNVQFALSILAKLLAALAGAYLASRKLKIATS